MIFTTGLNSTWNKINVFILRFQQRELLKCSWNFPIILFYRWLDFLCSTFWPGSVLDILALFQGKSSWWVPGPYVVPGMRHGSAECKASLLLSFCLFGPSSSLFFFKYWIISHWVCNLQCVLFIDKYLSCFYLCCLHQCFHEHWLVCSSPDPLFLILHTEK